MPRRTRRLDELPTWDEDGSLLVVVESPRGSAVKLEYEPSLDAFSLSRPLVLGVVFPFDFGFVPSTKAEDGDPLDALVLLDAPTFPGVVLRCRPIGALRVTQRAPKGGGRERNDRLVTVAAEDRRRAHVKRPRDLTRRDREELEAFFQIDVALEGKEVAVEGWGDEGDAREAIDRASTRRRGRR